MAKKPKITEPGIYQIEIYTAQEREDHWKRLKHETPETYPIQVMKSGHDPNRPWMAFWKADIMSGYHKTPERAIGQVKRLIRMVGA